MVQSHLSHRGRSKALYFTFYRWKSFRDFNPRSPAVRHQTGEDKAQKYYPGVREISVGTLREPSWLLRSHKDTAFFSEIKLWVELGHMRLITLLAPTHFIWQSVIKMLIKTYPPVLFLICSVMYNSLQPHGL